ncbi:MAG: zinc-ribbon domain-containing protein [Oscillospiraceae bacterium]|nr:zinc-ribbon domain-containing protein [Oscillospiraceae bacterium]
MLFCSHCGARIPEDAGFCYRCGTKVIIPEWDTEFPGKTEDEVMSPAGEDLQPIADDGTYPDPDAGNAGELPEIEQEPLQSDESDRDPDPLTDMSGVYAILDIIAADGAEGGFLPDVDMFDLSETAAGIQTELTETEAATDTIPPFLQSEETSDNGSEPARTAEGNDTEEREEILPLTELSADADSGSLLQDADLQLPEAPAVSDTDTGYDYTGSELTEAVESILGLFSEWEGEDDLLTADGSSLQKSSSDLPESISLPETAEQALISETDTAANSETESVVPDAPELTEAPDEKETDIPLIPVPADEEIQIQTVSAGDATAEDAHAAEGIEDFNALELAMMEAGEKDTADSDPEGIVRDTEILPLPEDIVSISEDSGETALSGVTEDTIAMPHTEPGKPIIEDGNSSEKKDDERNWKRIILTFAAAAAAVAVFLLYYLTRPENIYRRHMRKAEDADRKGDISEAAEEYNLALEIIPDSPMASERLDLYWVETNGLVREYTQKAKFKEAVSQIGILRKVHPSREEDIAQLLEEVYSSWAAAAAMSGDENDLGLVLDQASRELDRDAYRNVVTRSEDARARYRFAEFFTEKGERCLELNMQEDTEAVLEILASMSGEISEYAAAGGTFPVRTGSDLLGRQAGFYYDGGRVLQLYIGEFNSGGNRIGTADSYVILTSGANEGDGWYYTCVWTDDAPSGAFSAKVYGTGMNLRVEGLLKAGLYEGRTIISSDDDKTFYADYAGGKAVVIDETGPDGRSNVIGYTSDEKWCICLEDEGALLGSSLPFAAVYKDN